MKAVVDTAYRWSVLSRFLAAFAGGYALVSLAQLALTVTSPVEYYKSLLFSMQTSYLLYTGIIIWCFAARTATRAWSGLGLIAAPLALVNAWYWVNGGVP